MMIEIITTVETFEQAKELLEAGTDTLYFGEELFGLRLPASFTREEQRQLVELAHTYGKKVNIAMNGIIHPEKMKKVPEYLQFLKEIGVDQLTVGDTGIIYTMKKHPEWRIPYIFDAETLVTSARQINFWAKRGAVGAVLAREVPFEEMKAMEEKLNVPVEILVYGATCIHQSKRPLLQNYYHFTKQEERVDRDRGLFISEPKEKDTHYSIYEDGHGTHIFATNDVNMMLELGQLVENNLTHWKLDGIYLPGKDFVKMVSYFTEAKALIEEGQWSESEATRLNELVKATHPKQRGLDTGFYYLNPDDIR